MIDVSSYQGHIDWGKVRAAGVTHAYVKVSEGTSWTDEYYAANLKNARAAGVTVGAYHYGHPKNSPVQEVAHFLALLVGHVEPGDLPPCLDLEVTEGHDWSYVNAWKSHFLGMVDQHVGQWASTVFYSYYDFWRHMTLDPDRPVWGAAYDNHFTPPASWAAWQYTSVATCPGVSGFVDASRLVKGFAPLTVGL